MCGCCCCIVLIISLVIFLVCRDPRVAFDAMNGALTPGFARLATQPRVNFQSKLDKYNMFYYDEVAIEWAGCGVSDTYWNERGFIQLSAVEQAALQKASIEIHGMFLDTIDEVIKDDKLLDLFSINKRLWPAIKTSWSESQMDLQGRFDFSYDGKGGIKLLEYNADTPSLQLESGPLSQEWAQDKFKGKYQSSAYYITQAFEEAFQKLAKTVNKLCVAQLGYDEENTAVMRWMYSIAKKYMNAYYDDISQLKFGCAGADNNWVLMNE